MSRVLVTGANGFVGRVLRAALAARGHQPVAAVRSGSGGIAIGDIGPDTQWARALEGIDVVVHLAARVHVMDDTAEDPLAAFRHVNTAGTQALAQQAADAGVKRLIFVSSIKVNGEETEPGKPFTAEDPSAPADPYGISKAEAEAALKAMAGLETVIVRPPLVYGPGVKGNFRSLLRIVDNGTPLPLASIDNRRSFLALDNLVDLLCRLVDHPKAPGTWLASDGEDISTPELVRRIAAALDRPARLVPVPPRVLAMAGRFSGRDATVRRLVGSLQVDASPLARDLGWTPPRSMDAALADLAAWFRRSQRS